MPRFRRTVIALAAAVVATSDMAQADPPAVEPLRTIEEGVLDEIRLFVAAPPAATRLVVRPFDTAGADPGTGADGGKATRVEAVRIVKEKGPGLLAEAFKARLLALGPIKEVDVGPDAPVDGGALILEGHFTEINPGSLAKRLWAGFGSGKSAVTVEGAVKDAAGNILATFKQQRIAISGLTADGAYVDKPSSDCRSIGEDIAEFLHDWMIGKRLDR